jgi:hypothetical protein
MHEEYYDIVFTLYFKNFGYSLKLFEVNGDSRKQFFAFIILDFLACFPHYTLLHALPVPRRVSSRLLPNRVLRS